MKWKNEQWNAKRFNEGVRAFQLNFEHLFIWLSVTIKSPNTKCIIETKMHFEFNLSFFLPFKFNERKLKYLSFFFTNFEWILTIIIWSCLTWDDLFIRKWIHAQLLIKIVCKHNRNNNNNNNRSLEPRL